MSTQRMLAMALAGALAVSAAPGAVLSGQQAQPQTGTLSGKATAEAKKPYTDYRVQLRDPLTAQIVQTTQLTDAGLFSFTGVTLSRRLLVELFNTPDNKIVCTEGPFVLSQGVTSRTNIDINCGANPAAWWLIVAGAGAATGIAVLKASGGN